MERADLVRDWLYNNSLTAFVGSLLMLLARSLSDEDIDRDAASSSIQWTYPILDSVSPHLTFLHLPLGAILFVLAFALFVASMLRTSPSWAILIGKRVSPLSPLFVWVGIFTAWLPLTGDLFTTEPLFGAVTFYVGFLFLVLMSIRPLIIMCVITSNKAAVTEESELSNNEWLSIRNLLRGGRRAMRMQLRDAIGRAKSYAIRLVDFWISLMGFASITAIVWYFDPIGDLPAKIILTLLAAVMSSLFLLGGLSKDEDPRESRWFVVGYSAFSIAAVLIVFGDRINAPGLVINVASLLAASPAIILYWALAKDERLLQLWFVPIAITATLYIIPLNAPADIILNLLLVPLPVVSYACVAWAFAIRLSLRRARDVHDCSVWGPGLQSLAMLLLVAPLVALTMLAVNALQGEDVWVAVSGALVGILFSSAVSQPFGKFLLALGNLSTNRGCQGGSKAN